MLKNTPTSIKIWQNVFILKSKHDINDTDVDYKVPPHIE